MTKEEKQYLLEISRRTLEKYFKEKSILVLEEDSLKFPLLKEKRGVFVTLTQNGQLRGCIGNLIADKPVYQAIIENSLASALFDPRFPSLEKEELKDIKIEISVLSELKLLPSFKDINELIKYLEKKKPGLVIKKGANEATFLPQVWEELETAEDFLSQLCLKAGLEPDAWKKLDLIMFEYEVEKVKEENQKENK
ncbi:MAG TPA: AmmeMemoRadiSam system protein A [Candidatus Paceibacterota bacterium]|nr:AmmeMemoRadiSam system protein A [Candidatus Paceibacterota bacterium]